ncbi:MAG: MerR family transcriptional regulator [Bryobacterales bacterium]|nr:MerR family transcriptional regulator [Bryobacterales bacterium]
MSSKEHAGNPSWTLAELSEATGLPGRTIRYYISRGLLDGPLQAGRDASYGPRHLERLQTIAEFQRDGLTLQEIAFRLSGPVTPVLAHPKHVLRYSIGAGVTVEVAAGLASWRMRTIQAALHDFAARMAAAETSEQKGDGE